MTLSDGALHALISDGRRIFLRRAAEAQSLFQQAGACVWSLPRKGPASRHLWAPELHRLGGRWFIYYAADDGPNRNHRLFVLESTSGDPAGPYRACGRLETGGWAIDGTVLHQADRNHFLLWSGWEGREKGAQNLYIAPLRDPWTVGGPRVRLARPDQEWERRGGEIIEGPAVWQHGGLTGVVYSASASWTVHSCLGMLVHRGGSLLDPAAWSKVGPVFQRTPQTWGVGHCSLVEQGDGGGLIFYHAKTRRTRGWRDRNVRAQRFSWGSDGLPCFGEPLAVEARGVAGRGAPVSARPAS